MIVTRHAAARSTRVAARRGFTLMEVMVVAAILVILAGVGSVALFRYLDEAKESTARLGIAKIETAVMSYKTTKGEFPPNLQVLCQAEGGKPAFLEEKDILDPWNNPFVYEPSNTSATGKPLISVAAPPSGVPITNRDK
jgi:general secretion pathway protein G